MTLYKLFLLRNFGAALCCGATVHAWLRPGAPPWEIAVGVGLSVWSLLNCMGQKL